MNSFSPETLPDDHPCGVPILEHPINRMHIETKTSPAASDLVRVNLLWKKWVEVMANMPF